VWCTWFHTELFLYSFGLLGKTLVTFVFKWLVFPLFRQKLTGRDIITHLLEKTGKLLVCFEIGSHYVAQAGLKLLPQPLKCWDYRCAPPGLAPKQVSFNGFVNVFAKFHSIQWWIGCQYNKLQKEAFIVTFSIHTVNGWHYRSHIPIVYNTILPLFISFWDLCFFLSVLNNGILALGPENCRASYCYAEAPAPE
jgi:hypothetical protein